MEFATVIKDRYACKQFDGRPVPRKVLLGILEAGRLAPTAKNLQEQRVYVLESAEALAKFDQASPCRYGAPVVLIVAFNKDEVFHYPGGRFDSGREDASIVATHLMLAAKDAGVESCWVNRFDPDEMARVLELPENEEVLMALDLGYPAEGAGPLPNHENRKALEETVRFL